MVWPWKWQCLLLFAATILVHLYGTKACLQEERTALLHYKQYLKFHNASMKRLLPSWVNDPNNDCCSWERVTCNSSSGHVMKLSLDGLVGSWLHDALHDDAQYDDAPYDDAQYDPKIISLNLSLFRPFKKLTFLNLSYNGFDGMFLLTKDHKSTLKMLETLDLGNNNFSRSIFKLLSTTALTSLKNLILQGNNIGGPLPIQELSVLQTLESLDLSRNSIESPSTNKDHGSNSTLKMLETLDLSYNKFSRSIFKVLSTTALTSLKNLIIQGNGITGPLPIQELSVLQNLESLNLSGNSFKTPSTNKDRKALSKLKKLRYLDLSYNFVDKKILEFLVALPALSSLFLHKSFGPLEGILSEKALCEMRNLQELDLSNNVLTRVLHPCLGNLTSLRALDLSNNYLSGSIPSSLFAGLSSLEFLSLSNNNFEGLFSLGAFANNSKLQALNLGGIDTDTFQIETESPHWTPSFQLQYLNVSRYRKNLQTRTIPTFLLYQHELRLVDLSGNNLVGMFPSWLLANNSKLKVLLLNDNSFNGSFQLPSHPNRQMDNLLYLDISNNLIQNELPEDIGFILPNLVSLQASSNGFGSDIPASIGEMSSLRHLNLANNNFSGKLPKHMLQGCVSLEVLVLSHNSLEGQIFPKALNLGSLRILVLDNNHFNGTLGDGLLRMNNLERLILPRNQLSGRLPSWIGNLLSLSSLGMSENKMEGAIPKELCKLQLDIMDLSNNRFSGGIPSCLNVSFFLNLRSNTLTGRIPKALFLKSPGLWSIDLGDNKIFGGIPESMYRLKQIRFLLLGGNQLQGQISNRICQLNGLCLLDLSSNNFTGSIPSCLNNLYNIFSLRPLLVPSPSFEIHAYQYPHFHLDPIRDDFSFSEEKVGFTTKSVYFSYSGDILDYITGLDLSCNGFIGEIPHQIGDLIDLYSLNLSHNHLNGSIPESFHNLLQIESLDLSYNNLSGPIPLQLQELHFLSIFNVSYNNLSGSAPNQGQFGSFDESSYIGNPHLSWNISNKGIANQPPPPTLLNNTESAIDCTTFYWSFAASYVTVLLMLVTILWINQHWRRIWFYYIETCLYKCFGQFLEIAFY